MSNTSKPRSQEKKIKRALITAAGFGSRFLPITKTFPKELLPIINKPIIQYLVEECAEAGIEEVIIVVSPVEVEKFEDYFFGSATAIRTLMIRQNKLDRWDKVEKVFKLPKITILPQNEALPYGNGRPVLSAKDLLLQDEAFVVMFGDDVVLSEVGAVKQLVDFYEKNPCDGVLAVQEVEDSEVDRYGMVKLKEGSDKEVDSLIEKPEPAKAPSNLASYGRYILTPTIFDYLNSDALGLDNELWLQDANLKVAQNGKLLVKVVNGEWMTTGDPIRYMKAHLKFMLNRSKYHEELLKYIKELVKNQ